MTSVTDKEKTKFVKRRKSKRRSPRNINLQSDANLKMNERPVVSPILTKKAEKEVEREEKSAREIAMR